jgi:hypothetical protein
MTKRRTFRALGSEIMANLLAQIQEVVKLSVEFFLMALVWGFYSEMARLQNPTIGARQERGPRVSPGRKRLWWDMIASILAWLAAENPAQPGSAG